ncbi:MAG TPA: hypothetical protein VNK23_08510 [Candidatus Dormibacteraeota bacterium]|nr:hypothetical protein [Candidatus Dormibacteraeota bacterium]
MQKLSRRLRFSIGIFLALWPVVVAAFVPAQVFAGLDVNMVSADRLPLAIFCVAALLSEVMAMMLFFRTRVFPIDPLTSWSVIAATAAGTCTLAFLVAAVANVFHAW